MLLHDAVDCREPKPATLRGPLGCEEWLEDSGADCRVNSHARIGYPEKHVVSNRGRGGVFENTFVHKRIVRLNTESTTRWHRLTSVHRQIRKNLLNLTGVGHHLPHVGVKGHLELDVFANEPT